MGSKYYGSKVSDACSVLGVSVSTEPRGGKSALKAAQRREPFTDHTQPETVLDISVAEACSLSS